MQMGAVLMILAFCSGLWIGLEHHSLQLVSPFILKTGMISGALVFVFWKHVALGMQRLIVLLISLSIGLFLSCWLPTTLTIPPYLDHTYTQVSGYVDAHEKGWVLVTSQLDTIAPVRLSLKGNLAPDMEPGQTACLLGTLSLPRPARFLGDFDTAAYLKGQQLHGTFSVSKTQNDCWYTPSLNTSWWERAENHARRVWNRLNGGILAHRETFVDALIECLSEKRGALLGGIVLGDRASPLPADLKAAFINTGQIHLVAASGMNVSIIAGAILFVLGAIPKLPRALQFGFSSLGVLGYGMATGFPPSIVRAVTMWFFGLWIKYLFRPLYPLFILSIALFTLILLKPYLLNSLGFLLSVVTTYGILTGLPYFAKMLSSDGKGFLQKLSTIALGAGVLTAIAQLYATPLLLHTFGTVATYGILMNTLSGMLVIPLTTVGFIGYALSFVLPQLLPILLWPITPLLSLMVSWTEWGNSLPYALLHLQVPPMAWVLSTYALLMGGPWCIYYAQSIHKKWIATGLGLALMGMFSLPFFWDAQRFDAYPTISHQALHLDKHTVEVFHLKENTQVKSFILTTDRLSSWELKDIDGYFNARHLSTPTQVIWLDETTPKAIVGYEERIAKKAKRKAQLTKQKRETVQRNAIKKTLAKVASKRRKEQRSLLSFTQNDHAALLKDDIIGFRAALVETPSTDAQAWATLLKSDDKTLKKNEWAEIKLDNQALIIAPANGEEIHDPPALDIPVGVGLGSTRHPARPKGGHQARPSTTKHTVTRKKKKQKKAHKKRVIKPFIRPSEPFDERNKYAQDLRSTWPNSELHTLGHHPDSPFTWRLTRDGRLVLIDPVHHIAIITAWEQQGRSTRYKVDSLINGVTARGYNRSLVMPFTVFLVPKTSSLWTSINESL